MMDKANHYTNLLAMLFTLCIKLLRNNPLGCIIQRMCT